MHNLTHLFSILELSRNIPQYGYGLSGISKAEQSDIAQHQYLTGLFAWQLARHINKKGGNLNICRTMELAMVHDTSELLGGDINFHYARTNPEARLKAKEFESVNTKFIAKFFAYDENYFNTLVEEFENGGSDEAHVAKIADLVECLHYKHLVKKISETDLEETKSAIQEYASKCENLQTGLILNKFIEEWSENFGKTEAIELIKNQT